MQVHNRCLAYFYNRFDFIIRFLYCRTALLHKVLFWKLYSSDFRALDNEFERMRSMLVRHGFEFKDRLCLEIGPGNSYINAYNLLMNGAKKVVLVDKFPRNIQSSRQRDYFARELQYIREKQKVDRLHFVSGEELAGDYIQFQARELTSVELPEQVDFVLSFSVFEHIKNVESNVRSLGRIVRPGGIMFHKIDMRDHYNFREPFLFYKYSDETWNRFLTREGVSYTNRMRYGDFKELFETAGFTIIDEGLERFPVGNQKIDPQIARKDHLDVGIASIVLEKNRS